MAGYLSFFRISYFVFRIFPSLTPARAYNVGVDGLLSKADALPEEPGVYIFFDLRGNVLYVGKAKNLRRRVRTYFSGRSDGRFYFDCIVSETVDLECIITDTEKEAYLLENRLIRKNKPRYNVVFRDDKQYVSLRFTVNDPFPAMYRVRGHRDDGARYIGPFDSAQALRETLRLIEKVFPVRTCTAGRFRNRSRPCLKFQVGRCPGPCTGEISQEDYGKIVENALLFLTGKKEELTAGLRVRMKEASEKLDFERAAVLRDQIAAVARTVEAQKVVGEDFTDRDVFGFAREGDAAAVQILFVRQGSLVHANARFFRTLLPDEEVLASIVGQYYSRPKADVPAEILLPFDLPDARSLAQVLRDRRGSPVELRVPRRGDRKALVALAGKNACYGLSRWEDRSRRRMRGVTDLADALGLPGPPHSIECCDISHFGSTDVVGSIVSFHDGEPDKSGYMRFRIHADHLRDDPSRMAEVLDRRFARRETRPDLLVVDGGPGQLAAAADALARGEVRGVALAAIAKERKPQGKPERVYIPGCKGPVVLPENSPALFLLQRVRDEAHRFAVAYHRKVRQARTLRSGLEEAPLIGRKRRKSLLTHFRTLDRIRAADPQELAAAPAMNMKAAEALWRFLHEGVNRAGQP
jgi:excinuclease ABC subunit C